jgi:peptide/nickel transport system substrate-binding protein
MRPFALRSLALSSLLLAGSAFGATRPQYGGTLRITTRINPTSLDPADNTQPDSVARRNLTALLFDTLVIVDARGRLHPALATSWQTDPGNQRWTFVLRRDVKFHDNSPLTPGAVAASLRAGNPTWKILPQADSVIIERDAPAPELAADLARPRNAIVKREGNLLSGTGPFRVSSFTPGKHLTVAANEDSWDGRPYLDTIDVELGRSGRDQLIGIESARGDLAEVTPDQTARAALGPRRVLTSQPIELVALVFQRDPQSAEDRNLRAALALSIDRASIRQVILQSSGDPTATLLPNWISGYAFVFSTAQNLALARQKRAEVRQAPTWTIAYDSSDSFTELVAQRIILNAKDAGLTLQPTSSATPDLRLTRLTLDSADPRLALATISSQLNLPAPKLANASSESLYQSENAALQTQRVIPLFYLPASYVLSPQVRNASLSLTGTPQLADVWLGALAP